MEPPPLGYEERLQRERERLEKSGLSPIEIDRALAEFEKQLGMVCLPDLPSLQPLFAAHKRRKPECQTDPNVMSPMDEATWFDTPKSSFQIFNSQNAAQILQANPMRVGVIFSVLNSGLDGDTEMPARTTTQAINFTGVTGTLEGWTGSFFTAISYAGAWLYPIQGTAQDVQFKTNGIGGLRIDAFTPPWSVLQKDYGPLPSMEWWALPVTSGGCTVSWIEIILRAWPQCDNQNEV
jgi:hypothetical protein